MDKNTITGFVLIALVLIGFSWYTKPSEEEIAQQKEQLEKQRQQAVKDSLAAVAKA